MSDKLFDEKYKSLNKEQKLAVDTIEGPVMVVAGPGTGKTTILTLRIANILKRTDTPASGILALTFTDAGVKSMKKKLREIIGSRADEVRIHTFHSFAGSVFTEFPDHFPTLFRTKQITEIEAENIIREILKNSKYYKLRPLGEPDFYVGKILKSISDLKKENINSEEISNYAKEELERIKNNKDSISTRGSTKGELKADALKKIEKCEKTILLGQIFKEYEDRKKEERLLDYDDLLLELIKTINTDELLLRLLQEKFLYVLLDEHQDTNDSQNSIVMKIISFFDTPNIFVVGDEKQAIYRFQGASVQNFLKFKQTWKDMKTISLKSNYRSHQAILNAVFQMIENNYDKDEHKDLRVELVSELKGERPIEHVIAKDSSSQDYYILEKIKEITKKDKDADIAIIVRKNKEVLHFLSLCENNGIEASAERGVDIFSDSYGVLYFDILEFLFDHSNTSSLSKTIIKGLWGLDFKNSVEILNKLKSKEINIEEYIPEIKKIREEITRLGVIDFMIYIANISGFIDLIKDSPVKSAVWRAIIELSKEIANRNNISDPLTLIEEILKYKKSAESKSIKIGSGSINSKVCIMTAHSSKGLEFDYVLIPNTIEESWMTRNFGSSFVFPFEKEQGDEIKDARRLFYVAMTRAKKHIELISPLEDSGSRELSVLRFVDELNQKYINKIEVNKSLHVLELNIANLDKNRKKEAIEYTKRVITEKGLSVTALNHFLTCPREFYYKSILKIPEPPIPHSEKGIAMHKGLSMVWREDNRSKENIKKILDKNIKEYFSESLLPKFEKEILEREILEYTEDISRELEEHFSFNGSVFVEKWEEREFDIVINDNNISIILHGQLDCILDRGDTIKIYDYKTTVAKSIKEIKGENKNGDKNYFRQLVFYKFLLSDNYSYKNKKIEPALVFVEPQKNGKCPIIELPIEENDINELKSEIEMLVESVWSGGFLDNKCNRLDCLYCRK